MTKLEPCPFCGGKNIDPTFWASMDSSGPGCDDCGATAETAEKWNTRSAPPVWQPIETAPHETIVLLGWWYRPPWKDSAPRWECETGEATRGWRRNGVSTMSAHGQAGYWMPLPEPPALTGDLDPWDACRGCAPDATGGLSSEDFIRKHRDEDWR